MNAALNIDLHTHSNYSDGALSPQELVLRAAAAGVEVLALTDHDTLAGLAEAAAQANALGVQFVPGVEISASWRAQSIHILGLWVDAENPRLCRALEAQAGRRRERLARICAKLQKIGLPGQQIHAQVQAQPGLPTRAHLANALLAGGHVSRMDDAFRKYLGAGKPAYVAQEWPALGQVLEWIRGAGGAAVLAHPSRYGLSGGARRQLFCDFAAAGGAALEVVTGGNGAQHVAANADGAVKHGLLGSVGSDFHDPAHTWNPLGRSLKLPDCVAPVWRSYITKAAPP